MTQNFISIPTENKSNKKVFGFLKHHNINPEKIISSIDNSGNKNSVNLEFFFPTNHKIKKLFLMKTEDDYFLIIGHLKEESVVFNNFISLFLLNLQNSEITDRKLPKSQKNNYKTHITKINFYLDKILDKINEKGYDTLSIEEKKELNYISRQIN
ncbi:MAG: DUF6576 domain-containing protein [Bacteroidota bacterium]